MTCRELRGRDTENGNTVEVEVEGEVDKRRIDAKTRAMRKTGTPQNGQYEKPDNTNQRTPIREHRTEN